MYVYININSATVAVVMIISPESNRRVIPLRSNALGRLSTLSFKGGQYKVVPPSSVCWLIIPMKYRYNPLINPRYWNYKPSER